MGSLECGPPSRSLTDSRWVIFPTWGSPFYCSASGLIVGPSGGMTVALLITRQKNAMSTGLLSLPLMLAAIAASFSLMDHVDQLTDNALAISIALGLSLALMIAAIWLARHLTTDRQ